MNFIKSSWIVFALFAFFIGKNDVTCVKFEFNYYKNSKNQDSVTLKNIEDTSQGVKFVKGLSWEQVKTKARVENKSIFVDCYATWCKPCKYMSERIFTTEKIGKLLNERYICVQVQMDTTKKDDKQTKKWYATAEKFARDYSVEAYPTMLIFSPQGDPLHKIVGASETVPEFIEKMSFAENPDNQYFRLVKHYREHPDDSAFLGKAINAALRIGDGVNASLIGDAFLNCIKNPFDAGNLKLIASTIRTSESSGFKLLLENSAKVDTALGVNTSFRMLEPVVRKEDGNPKGSNKVDWDEIRNKLLAKYPAALAERVLSNAKTSYYFHQKMWKEFGQSLVKNMITYLPEFDDRQVSNNAWIAFLVCEEPDVIAAALTWGAKIITKDNQAEIDPYYLDTYACLLYKSGNVQDAITWEHKALTLAKARNDGYQTQHCASTIEEMKKGSKIWERAAKENGLMP